MGADAEGRHRFLLSVAGVLFALVAVEVVTAVIFRWPSVWIGRIPETVESHLRAYHGFIRGAAIQFRPDCTEPDPELLYRLRAGACRFWTDEFDTTLRVSTRHLREDREIRDPDLVVLGDSFSMGWGVEREAAFPAILGRALGLTEVVAAMSSYGTVRQLLLLRRLQLEDFGVLVVQYCSNDFPENFAFLGAGRHVPSSQAEYQRQVQTQATIDGRWLLKRARAWVSLASARGGDPSSRPEQVISPEEHARSLLAVLQSFAADLKGRPIVIFPEGLGPAEAAFVGAINAAPKAPELGRIMAIEMSRRLSSADRFRLDVHWRESGHRIVAEALARKVRDAVPPKWRDARDGG